MMLSPPLDPTMTPPPLHGFRGDPSALLVKPRGLTVAITREAGARGGSIARRVAEVLGWQHFNQDMLDYLNRDATARAELIADLPPGATAWADAELARLSEQYRLMPGSDTAEVMRLMLTVAAGGEAVLVGRGAGFVLPAATTIHVRVVAPLDDRIAFMGQLHRLTKDEAAEEVKVRDGRRAAFLSHLFPQDVLDPYRYDLIVNSSRLGEEGCADVIADVVRAKRPATEAADPFLPDGADESATRR